MHEDDQTLLQAYAREGAHDAFAALVHRHVNLVYSAARRQVRSHDFAQEVTQLVFIALARKAHRIAPDTPLAAWLYLVTRRTALDLLRREARRRAREQAAAREFSAMKPTPDWPAIEPWLDEAMATLSQADGSALLLRFFENKSLREVGTALGISEDAAQKRVSRALDQLRLVFSRKGVAVTAAGLATQLSAHAVEIAPAGVGTAVSATTLATAGATTGGGLVTLIVTTLQKNALLGALALAAGVAVYQGVGLQRTREETRTAEVTAGSRRAERSRLQAGQQAAAARLATVEREIDARLASAREPHTPADAAIRAEIDAQLAKLEKVDALFAARPDLATPELKFITRSEWNRYVLREEIETEADLRRVAAILRSAAQEPIAGYLAISLRFYAQANDGRLPDLPSQLMDVRAKVSHTSKITPALLESYEMLHTGRLSDIPPSGESRPMMVAAPKRVADMEYDEINWAALDSSGRVKAAEYNLAVAQERFMRANGGRLATSPAELAPHLKWSVAPADLDRYWAKGYGRDPVW